LMLTLVVIISFDTMHSVVKMADNTSSEELPSSSPQLFTRRGVQQDLSPR
jgi:hypothetical protein